MKRSATLLLAAAAVASITVGATARDTASAPRIERVAAFDGAMPTGVTVAPNGRIFVNFPQWGDEAPFTVAELVDGKAVPYPDAATNRPDPADPAGHFISVQSVVADGANRLWVLDTAALRSFELRPTAAAPAAAESGAKVDLRQRIWELTHIVHEAYTNHWPAKWERPTFANDPKNPTLAEWKDCPENLLKSSGCKQTLEKWRDAPETAPKVRDALGELIEKLMRYADRRRKMKEAERAKQQQQQAVAAAAQQEQLAAQELALEAQATQQRHNLALAQLQEELQALRKVRGKIDRLAVQAKEGEILEENQRFMLEQTALQQRHAAATAGMEAQPPQPQSEPPAAKRARR